MPVGYEVGDKATDFSLPNVDGNKVSLSDYADAKGYIVIFTCNHCPYAKFYEDRIIALDNKYRELGYPVIAINPNDPTVYEEDSFENMVKRSQEKSYPFAYVFDESQEVAKSFGAKKTPHIFLVQKEGGDFILKYIGAIDDSPRDESLIEERYVEEAISSLKAGKELERTTTAAVGCSIKWKKK